MSDLPIQRVVEMRVYLEVATLEQVADGIAALRARGVPGEAEFAFEDGFGGIRIVARYYPDGEDDGADDPDDGDEPLALAAPREGVSGE